MVKYLLVIFLIVLNINLILLVPTMWNSYAYTERVTHNQDLRDDNLIGVKEIISTKWEDLPIH